MEEGVPSDINTSNNLSTPQKSSSKKWIVILVVGIILVIGLVLAVMYIPRPGEIDKEVGEGKEHTIQITSAYHGVIPSGLTVVETNDVTEKIKSKENNYQDEEKYAVIPIDHESNPLEHTSNSHDRVNLTFDIPQDIYSNIEQKKTNLEIVLSCGDYGEIFVETENRFGEMDQLERVKCEENWEEIVVDKEIDPISNVIFMVLRKDGGSGSVKVDYARLYIK
tara:strand:+ start:1720 stop:2385 length:666 start_codon:yes stop_codon:yes gene_type:complete